MRRVLVALALLALLTGAAQAATAPSGTVTVTAGGFPLICGQVTGLLAVTFPAAARLPRTIAPAEVTVNGRAASSVKVAKHTVSVIVPRKPGITCFAMVLGKVSIVFAPRAHVEMRTARKATVLRTPKSYAARVVVS